MRMTARRAPAAWRGGWWCGAERRDSPHCDERPAGVAVSLVVMHSISLPPGVYGGRDVERLFAGTLDSGCRPGYASLAGLRVSAHFFVRRDGTVLQFVDADRRAWHAGVSLWQGRERCNDFSIGIEMEGLEGLPFVAVQYRSAGRLLRDLRVRFPIVHVVGHEHVAPGRKRDPGAAFDWSRLRRRLDASAPQVWPRIITRPLQGPHSGGTGESPRGVDTEGTS